MIGNRLRTVPPLPFVNAEPLSPCTASAGLLQQPFHAQSLNLRFQIFQTLLQFVDFLTLRVRQHAVFQHSLAARKRTTRPGMPTTVEWSGTG